MTTPFLYIPTFAPIVNGAPVPNGLLFTYEAGSNNPKPTFRDPAGIQPNTNPVQLDVTGAATVRLEPGSYHFVLMDSTATTVLWDQDFYNAPYLTAADIGAVLNPADSIESGSVVDFTYPIGHVYRYGTNLVPGVTDMTLAINSALNVGRAMGCTVQIPIYDALRVSASLNVTNCRIMGIGNPWIGPGIQASSDQFDVMTLTQAGGFAFLVMENLYVDGGNPTGAGNLSGNTVSLTKTSPDHPYVVSISNCSFINNKNDAIYIGRGGYTTLYHLRCLNNGLHGLEIVGTNTDAATTVRDYGSSQYGGCVRGFGVKLTEVASVALHDTIIEDTWGIQINGNDNRAITLDGVYQEVVQASTFNGTISGTTLTVSAMTGGPPLTIGCPLSQGVAANTVITAYGTGTGGAGTYTVSVSQSAGPGPMTGGAMFINDNNSGGIGLDIRGCFGGNANTGPFPNWQGVYYRGNSNLAQGAIPLAGRIQTNSAGQGTLTATGDATAAQLSLGPGTYLVTAFVQTIVQSGTGSASQLACQITSNSSASGLANSTSSPVEGAGQTQSLTTPTYDGRVNCTTLLQVFSTTTYYLRVHLVLTGTITQAYVGQLRAELIE